MPVMAPAGFILYSTGTLEHIFKDYKELHAHMQAHVFQTYGSYLAILNEAELYKEFCSAGYNLSFSLKQGYEFFVKILGVESLEELMERTTVCAYMSTTGYLCAHLDVVPETVKAIHYNHVPFTSHLH